MLILSDYLVLDTRKITADDMRLGLTIYFIYTQQRRTKRYEAPRVR